MNAIVEPFRPRIGPTVATGALLGLGLGGFLDGIILHQLLQWHQMISNVLPPDTLTNKTINMFWDGVFHVFTWTFTAAGVVMFWHSFVNGLLVRSTGVFVGSLLLGWGLFNLIDSVFNHYLFRLHDIMEQSRHFWWWNHGFLALAVLLMGLGGWIIRRSQTNLGAEK